MQQEQFWTLDNGDGTVTLGKPGEQITVPMADIVAASADFFGPITQPIPEAVTARQARLALLGAGVLANVDQALASIPGVEGEAARIEWEYASEVRRDSPLIAALAPALGLTEEQVDDLFRAAEGL
jgi:hypothetical protein